MDKRNRKIKIFLYLIVGIIFLLILIGLFNLAKFLVVVNNNGVKTSTEVEIESDSESIDNGIEFLGGDSDWQKVKSIRHGENSSGKYYSKYKGLLESLEKGYKKYLLMIPTGGENDSVSYEDFEVKGLGLDTLKERVPYLTVKNGLTIIGFLGETCVVYGYNCDYEQSNEVIVVDYSGIEVNVNVKEGFVLDDTPCLTIENTYRTIVSEIEGFVVLFYKG